MTIEEATTTQDVADPFPYEKLLAYYRRELDDAEECAAVERQIEASPRWQAHWQSMRSLDLEREAAIVDGRDLRGFDASCAEDFCRVAAKTDGEIFEPLVRGASDLDAQGRWSRRQWRKHERACPFCRRMRRMATANAVRAATGLPAGEPLIREWLLAACYVDALREARSRILNATESSSPISIVLAAGRFKAIEAAGRHDLEVSPRISAFGWTIEASSPQATSFATPALLSGGNENLVMKRVLQSGHGEVGLTLQIRQSGETTCEVEFTPSAPPPPGEPPVIKVESQGTTLLSLRGGEGVVKEKTSLPSTDFLPGLAIEVRLQQAGNELEHWTLHFE